VLRAAFFPLTAREKMTMTKAEIVDRVCDKNKLSHTDGINIVEATFEIIKASLERGENVKIKNFGVFVLRKKNSRSGRNPRTGKEIVIAARKVLSFKAAPAMKKAVATT
jgi:integration host factor subunit alpha